HWTPFDPLVSGEGVLPEVLFGNPLRLRLEELPHHTNDLVDRRDAIAVRPVAAKENPILSERAHQTTQTIAIGRQLGCDHAIHTVNDGRQLHKDSRTLLKLPNRVVIGLLRLGCRIETWEMVDDNPEIGNLVGDSHDRLQKIDAGICRIEYEIGLSQQLQSTDECGIVRLFGDVTAPQVSISYPPKQRILVVPRQHVAVIRLVGLQIANDADDDRVALSDLEHPQVVFNPGARFNLDRADDSKG